MSAQQRKKRTADSAEGSDDTEDEEDIRMWYDERERLDRRNDVFKQSYFLHLYKSIFTTEAKTT